MPICELCGRSSPLKEFKVEGVSMSLCQGCSKYGTAVKKPTFRKMRAPRTRQEDTERLVPNYAKVLSQERAKRSMTQEQFAALLNERVSVIQKWESGALKPRLTVARKLESFLGITLVSLNAAKADPSKASFTKRDSSKKSVEATLGDLVTIKVRKRK